MKINFSSNINEIIRAVINFLFFFTKRFRIHKKHQKYKKHQKRKKQKNTNKLTNIKNALKNICVEKVTYSPICVFVFFVHPKKRN